MLEPVLAERPFLLGERPTVADFGLLRVDVPPLRARPDSGPDHAQPRPRRLRVGRAGLERAGEPDRRARRSLDGVPADLEPLLREAGETHLPMLAANAAAHAAGRGRPRLHASRASPTATSRRARYRVWALARLRDAYLAPRRRGRALRPTSCSPDRLPRAAAPGRALHSGHDPEGPPRSAGSPGWSATPDEKCRAPPGGRGRTAAAVFLKNKRNALCRLEPHSFAGNHVQRAASRARRRRVTIRCRLAAAGRHPPDRCPWSKNAIFPPFGDQAGSEST